MTDITTTYSVPYNSSNSIPPVLPVRTVAHPGYTEYVYKTSPSKGRKFGVGIASWFITGLGQAINGDWGKGICMFAGSIALNFLSGASNLASITGKQPKTSSKAVSLIARLGAIGLKTVSIVDAVRHAKSETVQIVPNQIADDVQDVD